MQALDVTLDHYPAVIYGIDQPESYIDPKSMNAHKLFGKPNPNYCSGENKEY